MSDGNPVAFDQNALNRLFSENRNDLRRMVKLRLDRRLAARLDPSDVLQEAFLTILRKFSRLASKPSLPPSLWLRLEVRQALIDLNREHLVAKKKSAYRDVSIEAGRRADNTSRALGFLVVEDGTTPSQAAIREEKLQVIRKALTGLEENDREVLSLRHLDQMSNLDVSKHLGLEPRAASARYRRALVRMRLALRDYSGFTEECEPNPSDTGADSSGVP